MTRTNDKDFNEKWNSILRDCSQKLMEFLVDHYENQLTKNTMAISEAYDSLEPIENWSTDDRKELENEVHNHLEAQEKLLKEQKERKKEMVRRNQTSPPPPTSPRETYAEILKRHIREKVNPGNYDRQENWRFPRRVRRPRQERQQQYKDILKRRIVNLSSRTLTKSETNLLHKGLNFCPTPLPPRKEEIKGDNDAFSRLYRPSREPYLNTYVENIRQNIIEELTKKRRFQRNNLNARERAALIRLSDDRNIVIKSADKGGATVILNSEDYVADALRQLDNTEY
ncbi:hypothetical protein P5673_022633 [Acropora cervicornis]|uniref:Uncharacterized protein n=1 Tax=Acropora cervicornis TaxID=6130 RepID=A0AAD9Q6D4_ACRCE|nr:hypothetical protein P5673_022633 [Acropora cervicornis]